MENEHTGENTPDVSPDPSKLKPISSMGIIGYNLLALAVYTLLIRLIPGLSGLMLDAFVLFLHVLFSLIFAISQRSWIWFLTGILILAIGFSTCVLMSDSGGL